MQAIKNRRSKPLRPEVMIEQIALVIFIGLVLFFFAAVLLVAGYQLAHMDSIYSGVTISGVDVGGLTVSEATQVIFESLTFPQEGHILLTDGDKQWLASPAELGLFLDAKTTAEKGYQIGRTGGIGQRLGEQLDTFNWGREIIPIYLFNQNMAYDFLRTVAEQVYLPVIEPTLSMNSTEVVVRQGQKGRSLDTATTLELVTLQVNTFQDGIIPLVIEEQAPEIVDVSEQADLARQIINEPLILSLPQGEEGGGPWTFDRPTLAEMLSFDQIQVDGTTRYQVTLDSQMLYNFLVSLEPSLYIEAINARFMFNDDTGLLEVIEPAVIGHSLDVEASIKLIRSKLIDGEHQVTLVMNTTPPPATGEMTGAELGVTELVHTETSYFYGSSAERVQNIKAAASRFHGLMIAPGETFSMAEALGDISLDNGYAEALIILGGQTIKGVGGGVCQVSTTLFRAVFFAGFPIVERHSHAYRVSYYEKIAGNIRDESLAGLDATVYVPLVDFKFTNDTPHWLLMETYVNPSYSSIVWKFYSTKDGRTVEWQTSGVTNVIEAPKPLYRENPDLPEGEVKKVDYEADGAEVTVNRWVYRDGTLIVEDTFFTRYQPWQAIYEYGPGTEGMPPEEEEEE